MSSSDDATAPPADNDEKAATKKAATKKAATKKAATKKAATKKAATKKAATKKAATKKAATKKAATKKAATEEAATEEAPVDNAPEAVSTPEPSTAALAAAATKDEALASAPPDADGESGEPAAVKGEEPQPAKKDKKTKIEFEGVLAREEAVAYFQAILDGLRRGHVAFHQGDRALALTTPDEVHVEVEAQRKGRRVKVEFEMSWQEPDPRGLRIVASDVPDMTAAPGAPGADDGEVAGEG